MISGQFWLIGSGFDTDSNASSPPPPLLWVLRRKGLHRPLQICLSTGKFTCLPKRKQVYIFQNTWIALFAMYTVMESGRRCAWKEKRTILYTLGHLHYTFPSFWYPYGFCKLELFLLFDNDDRKIIIVFMKFGNMPVQLYRVSQYRVDAGFVIQT